MRPFIAEIARVADTLVAAYPNAGLPNEMGQYDEQPHEGGSRCRAVGEGRAGEHSPDKAVLRRRRITSAMSPSMLRASSRACRASAPRRCVWPDWSRSD